MRVESVWNASVSGSYIKSIWAPKSAGIPAGPSAGSVGSSPKFSARWMRCSISRTLARYSSSFDWSSRPSCVGANARRQEQSPAPIVPLLGEVQNSSDVRSWYQPRRCARIQVAGLALVASAWRAVTSRLDVVQPAEDLNLILKLFKRLHRAVQPRELKLRSLTFRPPLALICTVRKIDECSTKRSAGGRCGRSKDVGEP